MRILFVHDHPFKRSGVQYYSSGGLPASIWPRYTSVFEHVTVVGRDDGLLTEKDKGYTPSNAENVTFNLLPRFLGFLYCMVIFMYIEPNL